MILREILQVKGTSVHSISPQARLTEVVQKLVEANCGSLVVVDPADATQLVGIITERDLLRVCAEDNGALAKRTVADVMTDRVVTGRVEQSVEETMGLMTEHRIRHLPIVQDNRLVGIVSIGDIVKAKHDEVTAENHHLKNYIQS